MSTVGGVAKDLFQPGTLIGALFYAALFLAMAAAAARGVQFTIRELLTHETGRLFDPTAAVFLVQLARIAIFLTALTFYFHLIPALRALGTALLTGVSVVSVIIGLAAQGTLGNIVAGIALLLYRPFRLGDRVRYVTPEGLDTGTVRGISLGYTIMESFDRRKVVIPNSVIVNQVIVNLTGRDGRVMALVTITVDASADVGKARNILSDLAKSHPKVLELAGAPAAKMSGQGMTLSLGGWCASSADAQQVEFDVYEEAKKRFDQEKIGIH